MSQQLFTDLEGLSEEQIEVGLEAGVWGDPARPIVQRYLDQMKLRRVEAAAAEQLEVARAAVDEVRTAAEEQLEAARVGIDAARAAVEEARGSRLRATAALIIATGAMLAAMASGFVAFLALRNWTW